MLHTKPSIESFLFRDPQSSHPGLVVLVLMVFLMLAPSAAAQSIRLAWDPPISSQSAVSYEIQRGTATGTYTHVMQVGVGVTTADVTGLTPGVRYYFVVRAVDGAGLRSGPSNEVSVVAPGTTTNPPATTTPPPTVPPKTDGPQTVEVSTEAQLQAALVALRSQQTLVLVPGTYRLTRPLVITGGLTDVVIKGKTDRAADVVLIGPPPTSRDPAPVAVAVSRQTRLTLSGLSILNAPGYAIRMAEGVAQPRLSNLRLVGSGAFVQVVPDASGTGASGGLVENSTFDYTGQGLAFPAGIDIRGGHDWVVRGNRFTDATPTAQVTFGPAVLAWQGSSATVVEGNVFLGTTREIVLGLDDRSPNQHSGGIVRNNTIVRTTSTGERGAALSVLDSPDTVVVHNTVLLAGTSRTAIDVAHRDSTGVYVANNLLDGTIVRRDGATALLEANLSKATSSMFVAPDQGDCRLRADRGLPAIDTGVFTPFAPVDAAGTSRPRGAGVDIGARELIP